MKGLVSGTESFLKGNEKSAIELYNLILILLIGGCIVIIGMLLVAIIPSQRSKVFKKLRELKTSFVYAGLIRSI